MTIRTQISGTLPLWRISLISLLCGLACAVIIGFAVSRPMTDFLVYWTAPHLFLGHHNPYSLVEVFEAQKALGSKTGVPTMFLCPPWALTMFAPLGLMHSYAMGWFLWLALLIACIAVGSKLLMDIYFGDLEIPEISHPHWYRYLFAFTFFPTLFAIRCTQTSPLLFVGLAGFLHYQRKSRPGISALFLCITLIKPHLVLLVWVALLLNRQWRILAIVAGVTTLLTAAALLVFPPAFQEYWKLMSGPYPRYTAGGMLGGFRAISGGPEYYWIQSIPPILGCLWFFLYWRRHREWNWTEQLPVVVTASMLCAPYGFVYDQPLLVVPITWLAASAAREAGKIPFRLVGIYTAVNFAVLGIVLASFMWAFLPAPIVVAVMLWRMLHVETGPKWRPEPA